MKETYLFDFDGTLVDSMPTYVSLMLRILDENGVAYGDDLVKIITPLGFIYTAKYFRDTLGMKMPEDQIIALMRKYATHEYTYNIPAKSNVISVLRALKARGADLNVLTASPHTSLDPCLKRLGIWELFSNVWRCDDFGTNKSDTAIYQLAAEKMGTDVDRVWFLDDNINADKTAKTAGMLVCGVYDDSSADCVEEMKTVCDRYIYDFKELL